MTHRFILSSAISQEAWSPLQSDHNQFLLIDLQEAKHVLAIMTAGRPNTQHYTQNYSLDYGETLDQMISYTDELNYVMVGIFSHVRYYKQKNSSLNIRKEYFDIILPSWSVQRNCARKCRALIIFFLTMFRSQIFEGNNDSISFQRNDFSHPIVARFVRIIPRRWNGMIGLRVELFGCDYGN